MQDPLIQQSPERPKTPVTTLREAIRITLKFSLWFVILFSVLVVIPRVIVEIKTLGVADAWRLRRSLWLKDVLIFLAAGVLIPSSVYVASLIKTRLSKENFEYLTVAFAVLLLVAGIVSEGRDAWTKLRSEFNLTAGPVTPAGINRALREQGSAVAELSKSARQLLAALDKTIADTSAVRAQLVEAVATLDRQQHVVSETQATVAELTIRQHAVQDQADNIRELLGGQEPISRADLQKSQRSGWWQGAIVGLLTSVAGSFLFHAITRSREAKSIHKTDSR